MFILLRYADKWSPALQIRTVLLSIQALLSAPNPDDPLANDVADLWKSNEAQAIENGNFCSPVKQNIFHGRVCFKGHPFMCNSVR